MSDSAAPPNVLFILVDQLRRQAVGHLGGPVHTPNIDALARGGVSFTRGYCAYPMCTPTRAALLTGRYCHALRDTEGRAYMFNNRRLELEVDTYAKMLGDRGYRCGYVGKWHNDGGGGHFVPPGPRRQGFDDFFAGTEGSTPPTAPFVFDDDGRKRSFGEAWEPDVQVDLALRYLDRVADAAEPFCLTVSFSPPHAPLDFPPGRGALLDRARSQLDSLRPNVPERLNEDARTISERYHAAVIGIDECVGELVGALEDHGIRGNTLVVFVSDHGDHLLSHGLRGKNQCYEEAVGVPMIFNRPGTIREAGPVNAFANHIDVAPTLLDLCGIPSGEQMHGTSLAKLLRNDAAPPPRDSAYIEMHHPWYDFRFGQGPGGHRRCLVTETWKLVLLESFQGHGRVVPDQLFDHEADPYETSNLVADPGYRPLINELMRSAWQWMVDTEDSFFELSVDGMERRQVERLRSGLGSSGKSQPAHHRPTLT